MQLLTSVQCSVAEPPHFWAPPAPEVRGPRADSGSDQIGSAPGKKKAAPGGSGTNFFHFELLKNELFMQVFGSQLPLKIAVTSSFVTTTRLSFYAGQKDAAGAAFKKSGSSQLKIGSGSAALGQCA